MRATTKTSLLVAIAVSAIMNSGMSHANTRSTVKIVNKSSNTVYKINSSPTYRKTYGGIDLLGDEVLRPGYEIYIDFDTPDAENKCMQDIIAKGRNGTNWKKTMNVCEMTTWTLVD